MDLRPTRKKVVYAIIASIFISLLFFGFYAKINQKPLSGNLLSPEEFHLIYIAPIIAFLTSYFVVCWFVFRGADKSLIEQVK